MACGEVEGGRHDADDRGRDVVEANGLAEDLRIGVKVVAPDEIREKSDVAAAGLLLLGGEAAAERGCDAQGREEVFAGLDGVDLLLSVGRVEISWGAGVVGELVEGVGALAPDVEIGCVGEGRIVTRGGDGSLHKLAGAGVWEWAEEGGLKHGEHGGVGADS